MEKILQQLGFPTGNEHSNGVNVTPTIKAPEQAERTKPNSGPAKVLDLMNAMTRASQESGLNGEEAKPSPRPTNALGSVNEKTKSTTEPTDALDPKNEGTTPILGPADILGPVDEGIKPTPGAPETLGPVNEGIRSTSGPAEALDSVNGTTTISGGSEGGTFLVRKENGEHDKGEVIYGYSGSGENEEYEDYSNEEMALDANIKGDTFLVTRENVQHGSEEYNYEDGGSGENDEYETEDNIDKYREHDTTMEEDTSSEIIENSETEDYQDERPDALPSYLLNAHLLLLNTHLLLLNGQLLLLDSPHLLHKVYHLRSDKEECIGFLASSANGIGVNFAEKLGDRILDGALAHYHDKVANGLQNYLGEQTDKFEDEYKDLLKDTSGLAAGLNRPVEEADIQLVPKAGGTMGNLFAPPGWEVRHKYKYKDDSNENKGISTGQVAAYTYPNGLGPVLMNGCFGTGYKNGDPCYKAKIPRTGCPNMIDGATYLGVGFDGRGVYSAESRKKSVIQRSCSNLQTYGENEVPDSMTVQGIYDTDVETETFSSMEEYRRYLEEKSAVTDAKAMFQEEIDKASRYTSVGVFVGAGGGGKSNQGSKYSQSSEFKAESSATGQLSKDQVQTFMAMLEMNILR
ncbi:uncharacterized protein LOC144884799 [Branchiostoma floridae x Branchiostoma japonicum]